MCLAAREKHQCSKAILPSRWARLALSPLTFSLSVMTIVSAKQAWFVAFFFFMVALLLVQ
jgi:hypothetical protein